MFAAEWGVGQALWSLFWFFLFVLWIWLVVMIFADIIRSHDLGGWSKALWAVGIILFPYLGVFVYLIARGGSMGEREAQQRQATQAAFQAYAQQTAGTPVSAADELAKLADLKASGHLTDAEYEQMKGRIVNA